MNLITKCIIATFATAAPIMAQADAIRSPGYLVNDSDANIVMSGFSECWHTGDWTPQAGFDSCGRSTVSAVEPMPAPVVVAAAEPQVIPVTKNISFSDDALFAFDKSVLKPEGEVMLDGLVRQLDGTTTYDNITVIGHTDRFGSNEYNQKLSERRAQTVKEYLMSKQVRANRVDAYGKGEMQPVTNTSDCKGSRATKAVIACLQPDRRVDVEMTGTQTISSTQ